MSDRTSPAVTVVRVTCELDIATTPQLRAEVTAALEGRPQTLALDLSACPFAGVDALEELVLLTDRARDQGTSLVLVGLRPVLRMAIELLGLEPRLLYASPPAPRREGDTNPAA